MRGCCKASVALQLSSSLKNLATVSVSASRPFATESSSQAGAGGTRQWRLQSFGETQMSTQLKEQDPMLAPEAGDDYWTEELILLVQSFVEQLTERDWESLQRGSRSKPGRWAEPK